jgi:hypothetical protein
MFVETTEESYKKHRCDKCSHEVDTFHTESLTTEETITLTRADMEVIGDALYLALEQLRSDYKKGCSITKEIIKRRMGDLSRLYRGFAEDELTNYTRPDSSEVHQRLVEQAKVLIHQDNVTSESKGRVHSRAFWEQCWEMVGDGSERHIPTEEEKVKRKKMIDKRLDGEQYFELV